ncbi:hypothetical protein GEMRC1_004641 [Eukaryota sp. GEM-RC1]
MLLLQKKAKGAFKNRNRKNHNYVKQIPRLCSFAAIERPCTRQSCKFDHDTEAFVAAKPPVIDFSCPFSLTSTGCSFGLTCLCKDHSPFPTDINDFSPYQSVFYQNYPSIDLKMKLSKKNYDFQIDSPADSPSPNFPSDSNLWLAPLATLGHAPFRRLCVDFYPDLITCSEMVSAQSLISGSSAEFNLLRRHSSEKFFGIQLAVGNENLARKGALVLEKEGFSFDWLSLNCACPIDAMTKKGMGAVLMDKKSKVKKIVEEVKR